MPPKPLSYYMRPGIVLSTLSTILPELSTTTSVPFHCMVARKPTTLLESINIDVIDDFVGEDLVAAYSIISVGVLKVRVCSRQHEVLVIELTITATHPETQTYEEM